MRKVRFKTRHGHIIHVHPTQVYTEVAKGQLSLVFYATGTQRQIQGTEEEALRLLEEAE
jgi:hypothetical protein